MNVDGILDRPITKTVETSLGSQLSESLNKFHLMNEKVILIVRDKGIDVNGVNVQDALEEQINILIPFMLGVCYRLIEVKCLTGDSVQDFSTEIEKAMFDLSEKINGMTKEYVREFMNKLHIDNTQLCTNCGKTILMDGARNPNDPCPACGEKNLIGGKDKKI